MYHLVLGGEKQTFASSGVIRCTAKRPFTS